MIVEHREPDIDVVLFSLKHDLTHDCLLVVGRGFSTNSSRCRLAKTIEYDGCDNLSQCRPFFVKISRSQYFFGCNQYFLRSADQVCANHGLNERLPNVEFGG